MNEQPEEGVLAREEHRAYLIPFAGFSFAALLAVLLLGPQYDELGPPALGFVAYCLFVSFLAYYVAVQFQNHKDCEWQDQLGTTFGEVGSLGLILSVVAALRWHLDDSPLWVLGAVGACGVWLLDHLYSVHGAYRVFKDSGRKVVDAV